MNGDEKNRLTSENGWQEYKVYLLNSIDVINDSLKDTRKDMTEVKITIAGIKKDMINHSRVWGAVSGIAGAVLVAVIIKGFGI